MKKTITLLAVIIMVIITSMSNSFGQPTQYLYVNDNKHDLVGVGNNVENSLKFKSTDTKYTNDEILSNKYKYYWYNDGTTIIYKESSIESIENNVYKITFTSVKENNDNYKTLEDNFSIYVEFNITYLGLNDVNVSNLTLYPNPVMNVLNINFDATEDVDVTLMDMSGRILYTETTSMLTSVDMSDQPSGMYLVKVGNEMIKVVKQ